MFIRRTVTVGLATVAVVAIVPFAAAEPTEVTDWRPSAPQYDIGTQTNMSVTMDDGVDLRVDVKVPIDRATGKPAEGPFPSLLTQTPYGKEISGQIPLETPNTVGQVTFRVRGLFGRAGIHRGHRRGARTRRFGRPVRFLVAPRGSRRREIGRRGCAAAQFER